jgi:hypothetical protein
MELSFGSSIFFYTFVKQVKKLKIMEAIKQTEVTFDIFKTLYLIKIDEDLLAVFNMGVDISIQTAITSAKNGLLSDKTLEYVEGIYKIIADNESYLERYEKLIHNIKPEPIELTEEEFQIPRRYGKDKVVADIQRDQRKASQVEKTIIAVNGIKNMRANLERRLIHDLFIEREEFDGKRILTDEQCRDIIALQMLMANKLDDILKIKVRKSAKKIK